MFLPLGDDVNNRSLPTIGILLVVANVMAFAYTLRTSIDDPSGQAIHDLIYGYGLVATDLSRGQIVGVITHMFLHAGLMHLLGNMVVLWAFVRTLENAMGPWQFLLMYFVWGAVGGLAQCAMDWGSNTPLVGASGAIAGMIGAYWVGFGAMTKIRTLIWFIVPRIIAIPAGLYIGIWVLCQLQGVSEHQPGQPGIAWYAHLGGFLAGAITMVIVRKRTPQRLVETRFGTLEFQKQGGKNEPAPVAAVACEVPSCCSYCGTPLTESHKIGDRLIRCPNELCKRLVYMEVSPSNPSRR